MGGIVAAAGLGAVFVVGWLMFQHIPAWYTPPALAADDRDAAWDDLLQTEADLSSLMNKSSVAFEYGFTQDQINDWIAIREAKWPEARHWLPKEVIDPFVTINPDGARLAATVEMSGVRTVVSAKLGVEVGPGGIRVNLQDIDAGSLPIPKRFISKYLDQIDDELDSEDWCAGHVRTGLLIESRYVWPNGHKPFRIVDMRFERGTCVVRFEPLDKS